MSGRDRNKMKIMSGRTGRNGLVNETFLDGMLNKTYQGTGQNGTVCIPGDGTEHTVFHRGVETVHI